MGLKSFYYRQEEKYFNFLDRLEKKGINLYKIVDPLEKNGIPTFLLFNLIILLLVVFLVYMFVGRPTLTDDSYYFKFVDNQNQPISNQEIIVSLNNQDKFLTTDDFGIANLSGIKKEEYTLSLNDEKYILERPNLVDFKKENNYTVNIKEKIKTLSKTIQFLSDGALYTSPLTVTNISCQNNESYVKRDLQTTDGTIVLEDIPSDCGYLKVSIDTPNINVVESLEVNQENKTGEVNLSFQDQKTSSASIRVLDNDLKTPVSNISVSVVTMQSQVVREGVTNENGIFVFEDILVGTYKLVLYDNEDRYKPISEIENVEITFIENAVVEKEVLLEKAFIGKLSFKVIDNVTKMPIENVEASLYKQNTVIKKQMTDKEGIVSFGVEENISYKVLFNNQNYIIKTENNLRISDQIKTVSLIPLTSENMKSLLVTVQDSLSSPVEYATVRLWDAQEEIILQTVVVDVYGKAVFTNLDIDKTYRLDATKGKFTSDYTNPFRISEQEINEQVIKMIIGEGTFNINLKTEFGELYSGNIEVYDALNDSLLQDKTTSTNQEGFTFIKIRADKTVYFVIDNYESKFITPRYQINANEIKNLEFILPSAINTSGIEFLGFYNALGEKLNSAAPGSQVTAKFILNTNKRYSKAVVHLRTGDVPNPLCSTRSYNVSEDNIFIKEVRYAKSDVFASTTFTPCVGQTTDFSNKTVRNAKWTNLTINNPLEGSYLIEADLVVLDSAFVNQAVNYRVELYEGSSVVRVPIDSSLTSTATKQPLYAQAKQAMLFTGSQNQCTSLLCYSFTITNTQINLIRSILDSYSAEINNDYRLAFTLNMQEQKIAPKSMLIVSSGDSVLLKEYIITTASGEILKANNFNEIEIGNLTSNDLITGTIDFSIVDDIKDNINFTIISDGQEIFTKNILIDIKEAKELLVEFVPRKIVPFLPNDMMILVTDDSNNTVPSANVTVLLDNQTVQTGTTNSEGLFGFILPAPYISETVKIMVSKNKYRAKDISIVVDEKLISPIPQEITLTLDTLNNLKEIYNFSLVNETNIPLSIVSIEQTAKSEFVDLKINLQENILDPSGQLDIELSSTLTEKGVNLFTQQTFKNEIIVTFKNNVINKTWTVKVPVTVRIVLGNALDSLDCLKVLPNTATLRTKSKEVTTIDFTLENKCSSGQNKVSLGEIFAEIDFLAQEEIGVFSIVVSGREYILENLEETLILPKLEKDSKTNLQLKFQAFEIESAVSNPVINFKSLKGNTGGIDQVTSTLKTDVIISDYTECIQIPKQPVPLLACNWFSGYNMYDQYYGSSNFSQINRNTNPRYGGSNFVNRYNINNQFNPANQYQFGPGYYNQQQGYNYPQYNLVGQQGYVGPQASTLHPYGFPTSQFQNTFGNYNYNQFSGFSGSYGQMGFSGGMNCPQRPVIVTNTCAEAVDIRIDPTYGVTVVSENTFTLNPSDTEQVYLMGGEEMGTFVVPFSARPSKVTTSNYSLVAQVPVSVTLPISFMPSKCIQVTPQKLDFSNILDPKYQVVKVLNTCFTEGYRIAEINYLDLTALEFEGVSFLSVGENEGRIQPIKVDYLNDMQTNQPIEVWEIAFRRNPEIKNTTSAKKYLNEYGQTSVAAGIITTFRKVLQDVEDAVNLKFVLQVGLQPPVQAPLIYNNVGMELKDTFQWLILDNRDNIDMAKSIFGMEDFDDEDISFVDFSVTLGYSVDPASGAVFIEVPERELAASKFSQIDKKETTKRCFFGLVSDFPIKGIKDTSFINDSGTYYLEGYDPLKVSIYFLEKSPNIFKLCFTRPVEEIDNIERTNDLLNIYDLFKESGFKKQFELWAFRDESKSTFQQGHTAIGVKTKVDTRSLFDSEVEKEKDDDTSQKDDPQKDTDRSSLDQCLLPDLSEVGGKTGKDNFEKDFEYISFEYDSKNIDDTFCQENYCDQEQFYMYLEKKANKLKNSEKVKLGDVYFEVRDNKIVRSSANLDFCSECNTFDGKDNIESYLYSAKDVLEKIDSEVRKLTVIKTKFSGTDISGEIETLGDYKYMTVDYFFTKFKFSDLALEEKISFYKNMEVYYASSLNIFISKLKVFASLDSSENKNILNYSNELLYKNFTVKLKENKNISQAGEYLTQININNREISVDIKNRIGNGRTGFLYTTSINPNYLKSQTRLFAPFVEDFIKFDYQEFSQWNVVQEGYILKLINSGDDLENSFIDSRPVYFNKNYNFKLVETGSATKDIGISNNIDRLFLLRNTSREVSLYTNPQIESSKNIFTNTRDVKDNFMIYNLNMDRYTPNVSYSTVEDILENIKKGMVCYNIEENGIKLWHNPIKFK